ncbi:histidine phosphatase family protein [Herbaspirillum autotrophicum]|uniref:histidine phosphatase family protein n=1 Tax=Herbaspirillum autotrophicum TaxID=180195 RepID=UPI00067C5148|nr:histidine phosphatase family protein [Herbaspirillum autotrophicum]
MRLHLIRHSQTLVPPGMCYGSSDVAVSSSERDAVLQVLIPNLPHGAPLFSSPLQRCASLAEPLAQALHGGPVHYDARLAEMHFGDWEMCAWDQIAQAAIDAWAAQPVDYRPGGGESVLQMAQRIRACYQDLRLLAVPDLIVICHAGSIRLLQAALHASSANGMAHLAAATPHAIAYGSVSVLDLTDTAAPPQT